MNDFLGQPWLEALSAAALVLSLWIYVLLDGTDLGAGMLSGLERDETSRQRIHLSLLPVWDGNETWLVLGGAGLMAAFPKAYAALLSALSARLRHYFQRAVCARFRDAAGADRPGDGD